MISDTYVSDRFYKICELCGFEMKLKYRRYDPEPYQNEYVDRWSCDRCHEMSIKHPEVYQWVVDIMEKK